MTSCHKLKTRKPYEEYIDGPSRIRGGCTCRRFDTCCGTGQCTVLRKDARYKHEAEKYETTYNHLGAGGPFIATTFAHDKSLH
jgi:hypothetical protein